ncbi:MAG: hypothetical protein ACW975_08420 [Candidatus Thorarchaeota archaeon]|jgi:hypothetical protein
MSNKNASIGVLMDDLKVSFKFALKNILSFILGMIGVLIVTVLVMGLAMAVVAVPLLFALGGPEGFMAFFESLGVILESVFLPELNPASATLGILAITLIVTPFFVAIGVVFGMGREIVESAGTSAEGVFVWYRKKFFSLAGGGIVMFAVIGLPLILVYGSLFLAGYVLTGIPAAVLASLSAIWIILSSGMLTMVFPAIIDNISVFDATRQSIRLSLRYFDRVFSTWIAFILIIILMLAPLVLGATSFVTGAIGFDAILIMVYAVPAAIILVLIVLPALVIALSRLYMILSGIEVSSSGQVEPDVSLVGGM